MSQAARRHPTVRTARLLSDEPFDVGLVGRIAGHRSRPRAEGVSDLVPATLVSDVATSASLPRRPVGGRDRILSTISGLLFDNQSHSPPSIRTGRVLARRGLSVA